MLSKFALICLLQIGSPLDKLNALVDSIQHLPEVQHGTLAVSIRKPSGDYALQYNSKKAVNSASTLKLFSTATALSVLGKDFKYQTFLEYDGNIQDSTLNGNLYLRGTGDPSFGSDRFSNYPTYPQIMQDASMHIKKMGIKTINGFVVGDGSLFSDNTLADTWAWYDIGNYYGAGCGGLNLNENKYTIYFQGGETLMASTKILRTEPEMPHLNFINQVLTDSKGTGDQVQVYSTPFSETVLLEGKIPLAFSAFPVKAATPDAAFLAGRLLQNELEKSGVKVVQASTPFRKIKEMGYFPKERKIIKSYESPDLTTLCEVTNFESLNLYADALQKTVGYQLSKDASFDSSIKITKQYWQNKGVDLSGFLVKDGSGLSPSGFLTADNLADMLWVAQKEGVFPDFYRTIPVVGVSGTVKNLCKGTAAAGKIHAKSGSIEGTRAYSGYFTNKNGELCTFAFIINRYTDGANAKMRKLLEKMMTLMVEI